MPCIRYIELHSRPYRNGDVLYDWRGLGKTGMNSTTPGYDVANSLLEVLPMPCMYILL